MAESTAVCSVCKKEITRRGKNDKAAASTAKNAANNHAARDKINEQKKEADK